MDQQPSRPPADQTPDDGKHRVLFELPFTISKVVTIPSFICNILFGSLILILVYGQYREALKVYMSVVFFIHSELLQLMVITVLTLGAELGGEPTEAECLTQLAVQTFAFLLPGFMLLIITIVRVVFVSRPLTYYSFIRGRYQICAFVVACAICGLIASLPPLGLCGTVIRDIRMTQIKILSYCTYPTLCEKPSCSTYYNLLGLAFLFPLLLVIALYIYIYQRTQKDQKTRRSPTASSSSTQSTTADSNHLQVPTASNSSRRARNERIRADRRTIPWSILAILMIHVFGSAPWLFSEIYKTDILKMLLEVDGGAARWIYDISFAFQQVLIGACPLVYILTTRSLKLALKKLMSNAVHSSL